MISEFSSFHAAAFDALYACRCSSQINMNAEWEG